MCFLDDLGWLGAIGLVGIGLAIAGRRLDKTAGKVSPVLSSIWFSIAALSMCAWSVFIVLPRACPQLSKITLATR